MVTPAALDAGQAQAEAPPTEPATPEAPPPTTKNTEASSRFYLEVGVTSKWSASRFGKDVSFPITVHPQVNSYPGKRGGFGYMNLRFGVGPATVALAEPDPGIGVEPEHKALSLDANFDGVLGHTNPRKYFSSENHMGGSGFSVGLVASGIVHEADYGFQNGSLGVILGGVENHDNQLAIAGLTLGYSVARISSLVENNQLYGTPYVGASAYIDMIDNRMFGRVKGDMRFGYQGDSFYELMSVELATQTFFGFSVRGGVDISVSGLTESSSSWTLGSAQGYLGVDYRPKVFD